MNYWNECVAEALEAAGIVATDGQIKTIAEFVKGAHDNYGMSHGHDCIPNPAEEERNRLEGLLDKERNKVGCGICRGRGFITENFGTRSSTSQCDKCHGEGKHARGL